MKTQKKDETAYQKRNSFWPWLGVALSCTLILQSTALLTERVFAATPDSKARVPLILEASIKGSINPATHAYLESVARKAKEKGATAIVVTLDTPGGLVSSAREMVQTISQSPIPIIVMVSPSGASATSAGALITLASPYSVMVEGTHLGAAHPVGPQGEDIKGNLGEKAVSDLAALARSLAELHGRDPELAQLVVTKSKSFTAKEAQKNRLINLVLSNSDDLYVALNGKRIATPSGEVLLQLGQVFSQPVEMSLGQKILHTLANPNIATILMSLAILLIYLEISNPGLIVPGVAGGILLLISFTAFQFLPIRTGGLVLLVLGIAFLIAEPFVVSSGALAAGGLVSFLLGILWVLDPSRSGLEMNLKIVLPVIATLGFLVFLIGYAASQTRQLAKSTLKSMGGGGLSGLKGYIGKVMSVDESLHHGTALFRGEIWTIRSDHPLREGKDVQVESTEGLTLLVVEPQSSEETNSNEDSSDNKNLEKKL